jgi:GT2 family glycosyltransferase
MPLVTVGIPLYRSRRFVEIICANVAAIDCSDTEILISDRHGLDDAIDVLRKKLAQDPRVRFLTATDQLGWVDHFNLLLREARGAYALWMAHDDSYPAGYVTDLVKALEARPDAVLAFGRVELVSLDGFLPALPFAAPPTAWRRWSVVDALRWLTTWQMWVAFRGAVRCDVVRSLNLYIRPTYRNVRADIYWLFALALRGPLVYVPSTFCTKRFYRASAGAEWRFTLRHGFNSCRVLYGYLSDFARSRVAVAVGWLVLTPWCLVQPLLPHGVARRLINAWQIRVRGGYPGAEARVSAAGPPPAGQTTAPS